MNFKDKKGLSVSPQKDTSASISGDAYQLPYFSPYVWHKIIPPFVLSILTTLFYYPSLWYPFQFDDVANITKNFHIRFFSLSDGVLNSSRWISDAFNGLCFKLGRFDPFYYRVTNLGIHLIAGLILFYLVYDLCSHLSKKPFIQQNAHLIAIFSAGLFLLHPVQTQTVSYVIQARMEGIATLFILATILAFTKAMRTSSLISKTALISFAFLLGFLACRTKEIVVIMPFLVVLVDWFLIAEESWDAFKGRLLIYTLFAVMVIGSILMFLDLKFIKDLLTFKVQTANNRGNILTNHAYDYIRSWPFFISQFKVVLHYLVMFIWPFNICVEYDWKLVNGFFSPDSFFPFLALTSIFSFAAYSMFKKKNSILTFGLFWFLIAVTPRSSIIPSSELICDYKAYLAGIGIIFILSVGLVYLIDFLLNHVSFLSLLQKREGQLTAALLTCTLLGYSSFERNKVWETPLAFWSDIVKKAPQKARGHNNLGVALAESGKTDEAIECYIRAIKLDAYYTDPYNNLAVGYTLKDNLDKAIMALNQAIALFPLYPEAYNNRGSLYLKKKEYPQAEQDLMTAVRLRGHYGKAFYNLGRLHYEQGNQEKAWTFFKKATETDLDDVPHGFHTLGQLSLHLKKFDDAVDSFEKMINAVNRTKNLANREEFLKSGKFNLANAYFMAKQFDKALALYDDLCKTDPFDPRYLHNLGETYYTKNEIPQALSVFNRARSLPTTLPQTHLRLANCLEKLNKLDDAKTYLESLLKVESPDDFKKTVNSEIARITLQDKVNKGNGKIKFSDLGQAVATLDKDTTVGKNPASTKAVASKRT